MLVVLGDNQPYLVTMFLKGFPDFYYSRLFKGEKKKMFPKSKLFQQGSSLLSDSKFQLQDSRIEVIHQHDQSNKSSGLHLPQV
jgi:hypothetical protein